jgi:hypothetical protein
MSDDKKRPVIVKHGPAVKDYAAQAAERAAAARAARPKIGNLAQANEQYKPGKDRPMTIAQVTQAQRAAEESSQGVGLKPETVTMMKAVAEATAKKMAERGTPPAPPMPSATVPPPIKKEPVMSEAKAEQKPPVDEEAKKTAVKRELDKLDDFDIEKLMRSMQEDVINNSRERDHVNDPKNGRITEIDFMKGLAENSFEQWVEVVPGRLNVLYRTLTPLENQSIRLWIFKQAQTNELMDRLAPEIYGLAQVVAAVRQINTQAQPEHVKGFGHTAEFDDDAFAAKYAHFRNFPNPLIHAIGVHANWFDLRVRDMFTTDALKNG